MTTAPQPPAVAATPSLVVDWVFHEGVSIAEGPDTSFLTAYGLAKLLVCAQIQLRLSDKVGLFSTLLSPLEEARVMIKLAAWRRLRCGDVERPGEGGGGGPADAVLQTTRAVHSASPPPFYPLPRPPPPSASPSSSCAGDPRYIDVRSHLRLDVFTVMRYLCGESHAAQTSTLTRAAVAAATAQQGGAGAASSNNRVTYVTAPSSTLSLPPLAQSKPQLCLSHRYATRTPLHPTAAEAFHYPAAAHQHQYQQHHFQFRPAHVTAVPAEGLLVGCLGAQFSSVVKAAKNVLSLMSGHCNDVRRFTGNRRGGGGGFGFHDAPSSSYDDEEALYGGPPSSLGLTSLRHVTVDTLIAFGRTVVGTDHLAPSAESFLLSDVGEWLHPLSAMGAPTALLAMGRCIDADLHIRLGSQTAALGSLSGWAALGPLSAGWLVANRSARGTIKHLASTADGKLTALNAVYDFILWLAGAYQGGLDIDGEGADGGGGGATTSGFSSTFQQPHPQRTAITCEDLAHFCAVLMSHSLTPHYKRAYWEEDSGGGGEGAASAAPAAAAADADGGDDSDPLGALVRRADTLAANPTYAAATEGGIVRPNPAKDGQSTASVFSGGGGGAGAASNPNPNAPPSAPFSASSPLSLADGIGSPFAKLFSPLYWQVVTRVSSVDAPITRAMFWGVCELATRAKDADGRPVATVIGGGGGAGAPTTIGAGDDDDDGTAASSAATYAAPELTIADFLTLSVAWEVIFSGCGCADPPRPPSGDGAAATATTFFNPSPSSFPSSSLPPSHHSLKANPAIPSYQLQRSVRFLATRGRQLAAEVYDFTVSDELAKVSGAYFLMSRVLRDSHLMLASAESQWRMLSNNQTNQVMERSSRLGRDIVERPPLSELWGANEAAKEFLLTASSALDTNNGDPSTNTNASSAAAATTTAASSSSLAAPPPLSLAYVPTRTLTRTVQLCSEVRADAVVAYTTAEERPLSGGGGRSNNGGSSFEGSVNSNTAGGGGGYGSGGSDVDDDGSNRASIDDYPSGSDDGRGSVASGNGRGNSPTTNAAASPPQPAASSSSSKANKKKGGKGRFVSFVSGNAAGGGADDDGGVPFSSSSLHSRLSSRRPAAATFNQQQQRRSCSSFLAAPYRSLSAYQSVIVGSMVQTATAALSMGNYAHAMLTSSAVYLAKLKLNSSGGGGQRSGGGGGGGNAIVSGGGGIGSVSVVSQSVRRDAMRILGSGDKNNGTEANSSNALLHAMSSTHGSVGSDSRSFLKSMFEHSEYLGQLEGVTASSSALPRLPDARQLSSMHPLGLTVPNPFYPIVHRSWVEGPSNHLLLSSITAGAAGLGLGGASGGGSASAAGSSAAAAARRFLSELKAASRELTIASDGDSWCGVATAAMAIGPTSTFAAAPSAVGTVAINANADATSRGAPLQQRTLVHVQHAPSSSTPNNTSNHTSGGNGRPSSSPHALLKSRLMGGVGSSAGPDLAVVPMSSKGGGGSGPITARSLMEDMSTIGPAVVARPTSPPPPLPPPPSSHSALFAAASPQQSAAMMQLEWCWRYLVNDLRWQIGGFAREVADRIERVHVAMLDRDRGGGGGEHHRGAGAENEGTVAGSPPTSPLVARKFASGGGGSTSVTVSSTLKLLAEVSRLAHQMVLASPHASRADLAVAELLRDQLTAIEGIRVTRRAAAASSDDADEGDSAGTSPILDELVRRIDDEYGEDDEGDDEMGALSFPANDDGGGGYASPHTHPHAPHHSTTTPRLVSVLMAQLHERRDLSARLEELLALQAAAFEKKRRLAKERAEAAEDLEAFKQRCQASVVRYKAEREAQLLQRKEALEERTQRTVDGLAAEAEGLWGVADHNARTAMRAEWAAKRSALLAETGARRRGAAGENHRRVDTFSSPHSPLLLEEEVGDVATIASLYTTDEAQRLSREVAKAKERLRLVLMSPIGRWDMRGGGGGGRPTAPMANAAASSDDALYRADQK